VTGRGITIATSIGLEPEERGLLEIALPGSRAEPAAQTELDLPSFSDQHVPDMSGGWQYSYDFDPDSVLVVALNSVGGAVAEEMTRQLTEGFWLGVKGVLKSVRRRRAGTPMSSVQVRGTLAPRNGVEAEFSLTSLHADYAADAEWASAMAAGTAELPAELDRAVAAVAGPDGTVPARAGQPGSKVVVYGFVEGGGTLEWHAEGVPS
jgi:hypothetical protein